MVRQVELLAKAYFVLIVKIVSFEGSLVSLSAHQHFHIYGATVFSLFSETNRLSCKKLFDLAHLRNVD